MKQARLSAEDWIRAGFRALVAQGPQALKAESLARDLGTTKGSFYWHFKDVPDFHTRMLGYWHDHAFAAVATAADREGTPTERLYRLVALATDDDPQHGGAGGEPAIRAWGRSNPTVANAVREIDEKRLAYVRALLGELGLPNPELARLFYGAYVGMGTLSASDGADNSGPMSTLIAAFLALRDA